LKNFVPSPFLWTIGAQKVDIVPKLPTFLRLAEIAEPAQPSMAIAKTSSVRTGDCLFVLLEVEGVTGRFFCAESGKFLIPVVVYADNLTRPIKRFVEIYWTGVACSDVRNSNFAIRLLSEREGMELTGGEV
jgi:hypothetical protein